MQPRKTFSLKGAKAIGNYNKEKTKLGLHLCRVKDLREKHGHGGHGLWLDFVVVAVAGGVLTKIGFEGSQGFYPDNARASGRMTTAMAYAAEQAKMQACIGAVLGYTRSQSELVDDALMEKVVAVPDLPGGMKQSPVTGRLFVVDCKDYTNKKGDKTSFYEILPYSPGDYPELDEAAKQWYSPLPAEFRVNEDGSQDEPEQETSAPPPSGSKKSVRSFEADAIEAGFTPHADAAYADEYAENIETGEVVAWTELKTRLGY